MTLGSVPRIGLGKFHSGASESGPERGHHSAGKAANRYLDRVVRSSSFGSSCGGRKIIGRGLLMKCWNRGFGFRGVMDRGGDCFALGRFLDHDFTSEGTERGEGLNEKAL